MFFARKEIFSEVLIHCQCLYFCVKKKKIQPRKKISYQLCDRNRTLEIIFSCDLPLFDERSFLAFSTVRQTRYMEVVFRVRSNHKT